jgi:hypothetical protein
MTKQIARSTTRRTAHDEAKSHAHPGLHRSATATDARRRRSRPVGEWIAFRDDMDDLEASLNVNRPDLDWSEAIQPFKDEADAAIRTLTNGSKLPRRED